jgi:hypothetical protein
VIERVQHLPMFDFDHLLLKDESYFASLSEKENCDAQWTPVQGYDLPLRATGAGYTIRQIRPLKFRYNISSDGFVQAFALELHADKTRIIESRMRTVGPGAGHAWAD